MTTSAMPDRRPRSGESRPERAGSDRDRILAAASALLVEHGARGLTVSAVMERAAISRTAFYRRFDGLADVVAELLRRVALDLALGAADWFTDPSAVGSRSVVHANSVRAGTVIQPHAQLLCAISDAAGLDGRLREAWWSELLQPRLEATAAAIERDQAAGAVRPELDAHRAALALTLLGERTALEILGRRRGSPEDFAAVVSPIWEAVLFGV